MKHKNTLWGLFFMVAAILNVSSCKGPAAPEAETGEAEAPRSLKIAYVELDSLMSGYQFCKDYMEILQKKHETIQNTLSSKELSLQKQQADFESKLQQGAFTSREQAESVQASLQKKITQYQNLAQSLGAEFTKEQERFNEALHDSVNHFLASYNETYGYSMILSRAADNILLADPQLDITADVVKGLNKRYRADEEIKKALGK
ncbi:MAG: OmpH family outer membrane protein [Bacteroidaceae bacterium]|nr:OmpH family outer membrane protein [Bacteroidaceae bacterium]